MSKILSLATIDPPFRYTTEQIIKTAESLWLNSLDPKVHSIALKILKGAEIAERYSVVPLETVFADLSFQEKNDLYVEAMKKMAEEALVKACQQADISPRSLDYLITTSCTGFMIPSVDAYLVDKLGLRQDIVRMPITEMGCAGGTSGLIYASRLLKNDPHARAALICSEAPSLTLQRNDFSMENLVSTAIFADGAACAILGNSDRLAPKILDSSMYHFPDSAHLMGYKLTNSGLKIVLDREVPDAIAGQFEKFFYPLMEKNSLQIQDIDHFIFHPGGKKIIQSVEKILHPLGKDVDISKAVLRSRGNLSSATVLFVLAKTIQEKTPQAGELGYLLAFGPGFSAQSLLVEWRKS